MNIRKFIYLSLWDLRGEKLSSKLSSMYELEKNGNFDQSKSLTNLLSHCQKSVPYYQKIMKNLKEDFHENPYHYLKKIPPLTKEFLRENFNELTSQDLNSRKWFYNTSGGSTGEPIKFIQDYEFAAASGALSIYFDSLIGREIGEPQLLLWGSERDIIKGREKIRSKILNKISNTIFVNTFKWSKKNMLETLKLMEFYKPKIIVSYVDAIYELANFVEQESISIEPQSAIITSAGTLFPYMREKIQNIFNCKIYDRYGSRECGLIACERPGFEGLFVPPWNNYVEIINENSNNLFEEKNGELFITSLINYSMPLIRYKIEDLGILIRVEAKKNNSYQVLSSILGRTNGMFRKANGELISPGYFTCILCDYAWIKKYQIIQKDYQLFKIKIIKRTEQDIEKDLIEIKQKIKIIMGSDCNIEILFYEDLPAYSSGKFQYTICEI